MRGYSRAVAPGIPLVSISVSFAALRFLSWAEPRALPGKAAEPSAFAGPAFADRRQHPARKTVRLLPWAQAVPLEGPVTQRRPPRVIDFPKVETAAAAVGDAGGTATSGGRAGGDGWIVSHVHIYVNCDTFRPFSCSTWFATLGCTVSYKSL